MGCLAGSSIACTTSGLVHCPCEVTQPSYVLLEYRAGASVGATAPAEIQGTASYVANRDAVHTIALKFPDNCLTEGAARATCTARDWLEGIRPQCASHRVRELFFKDPYTRRAYEKPRGYAGDAVMLDYVYTGVPPEDTTPIGRTVFAGTTRTGNGRSVVERRDRIAATIDACSRQHEGARVLSLACGHVRETELSSAVRGGGIDVLFAVDQDPESLAVVARERVHPCIEPVRASVGGILKRTTSFERLHLIYSLGLYDYLPDDVARRLTAALFEMLVPGGTLVLANFLPDNEGRGYMEAFMAWDLVCRDQQALASCAADVPPERIASQTGTTDALGNIAYLTLVRS